MTTRVAIMGFGRMGRNVFRLIYAREDIEVVAISDIAASEAIEYLLRHDTLHGAFPEPVRVVDNFLYAKGHRIPILHIAEPDKVPWFEFGVDIVIEATGRYRHRDELAKHLERGADRVILTTPPQDALDATYLAGITPGPVARDARLISCGSSTAHCTALMLKVLDDAFGVTGGYFTSVHAYTTEQSLIDTPAHDLRLSRAAVENIVPTTSWTAEAIGELFPHLAGKFSGAKLHVPVPDVSCVDLVATVTEGVEVTAEAIREVFRSASNSRYEGLLEFVADPIVSSDVAGSKASCVFDSLATMEIDNTMVKVIGWYEQGGGLAARIVEMIEQLAIGEDSNPDTAASAGTRGGAQ